MAFDQTGLSVVQWDGNNTLWKYVTSDSIETVLADGYFDAAIQGQNPLPIRVKDIIIVTPQDGLYGGSVFVGVNGSSGGDVAVKYLQEDSRFIYLADHYNGENYWDDAWGRATAARGNAGVYGGTGYNNLLKPSRIIMLPTAYIEFSDRIRLGNDTFIMGTGQQSSRLVFRDLDPASTSAMGFVNDGFGFTHWVKLFGFQIYGVPDGVHCLRQDTNLGEYSYFDQIAFSPANHRHLGQTARGGTSTTIDLANTSTVYFHPFFNNIPITPASTIDDTYNGLTVTITAGTGVGQVRTISDYSGSLRRATVSVAWDTVPDNTSIYDLQGTDASVNSDGYHCSTGSNGSTPFRHGLLTCWSCRYGVYMNGPQQLNGTKFEGINGDNCQWFLGVFGGFNTGGVHVGNMKGEQTSTSDPNLPGSTKGWIEVSNAYGSIVIDELKCFTSNGANPRTATAIIDIKSSDSNRPGRVDVKQIFIPQSAAGGFPTVYRWQTLGGGSSRIHRSLRFQDIDRLGTDYYVEFWKPPVVGHHLWEYGVTNQQYNVIVGPPDPAFDFRGSDWYEYFDTISGTDPQAIIATPVSGDVRGAVELTTGNDSGLTASLNGSMLAWNTLEWQRKAFNDPFPGERLVFEWSVRRTSGNPRCFIGFTDVLASAGPVMPYRAIAGTVTDDTRVTDGGGFLFDPASTAGANVPLLVATNAGTVVNTTEVKAESDIKAAGAFWNFGAEFQVFRIVFDTVQPNGNANNSLNFYIDSNYCGSIVTAYDHTALVAPCICIDASSAAQQKVEVDWFRAFKAQGRRQV